MGRKDKYAAPKEEHESVRLIGYILCVRGVNREAVRKRLAEINIFPEKTSEPFKKQVVPDPEIDRVERFRKKNNKKESANPG